MCEKYCANCGEKFNPPEGFESNPCCCKACWEEYKKKEKEPKENKAAEMNGTTEPNYRLNFKQNAKCHFYCEYTVRGNTIGEVRERLKNIDEIAQEHLKKVN